MLLSMHTQWCGHSKAEHSALPGLGLALATVKCGEIKGSGNDTGEEQQRGLPALRDTSSPAAGTGWAQSTPGVRQNPEAGGDGGQKGTFKTDGCFNLFPSFIFKLLNTINEERDNFYV